ncbi:hypothetical protein BC459_18645 [Vibrio parahaemolyticus]|uniref:restriction endonuclease subunit S n=1 Tax=Vibrio parahaemolyticus TaxID=670 RepID=UPI00223F6E69|nr:restriction endonuclease subunit S [Vibrio parahaemolyticus]MCW8011894.1 hypothetical protein [Vibrio parahaemolyticus]
MTALSETKKYQAYPEYKDSGVEWVGNLPVAWDLSKLKHMFSIINGSTPKSGISTYWDGNITWVTPADLSKLPNFQIGASVRTITEDGLNSCGTTIVPSGSLVLSSRAPIGSLAVTSVPLCTNQGCKSLVVRESVCVKYVYYYLSVMKEQLNLFGRGTTFLELSTDDLGNFPIPLLAQAESENIANFLDHETAKIDTLIEKQQQLIKLLKEKRQAVISHAVTKGLNPQAPMKDSGVEWLGEVPEHWVVSKFAFLKKVLTDYTANGSFADLKANVQYLDEPSFARLVRLTDLRKDLQNDNGVWVDEKSYKYLKKSALFGGEFLLANVGAYAGLFYQMPFEKGPASLAPNMFMAKFDDSKVSREFMAYVGQSSPVASQLRLSATASSAQPKLNKDDFKSVSFCYPTLREQNEIVEHLNQEVRKIEQLLTKQERAIALMQERRTALISAAVTGKIDVRNWQAPTPEYQAMKQTA